MQIQLVQYDKNLKRYFQFQNIDCEVDVFGAKIIVSKEINVINDNVTEENFVLKVVSGSINNCAVFFDYNFTEWNTENYVFAPAALYNGNRFESIAAKYPPMLKKENKISSDMQTVISDVPKLSTNGIGVADMNVGDLATPCFAYLDIKNQMAEFFYFNQQNLLGNYGIKLDENKTSLKLQFSSPCMRDKQYSMCNSNDISFDKPCNIKAGDTITFKCQHHKIMCSSIAEFYNYFFFNRFSFIKANEFKNGLPWGYGAKLVEDKYNMRNWQSDFKFYRSSEAASGICSEWQTGWVGGGMNTLYNLILGNELSKERAISTLNFIFDKIQCESGFMYGIFFAGTVYGDNFHNPTDYNVVMSRKNADLLYYLVKQMAFLKVNDFSIPNRWIIGLKKFADAFCNVVNKYNHAGQFLNIKEKNIVIGATTSAGIISAALALCSKFFNEEKYLKTAERAADYYYKNYLSKGLTNGGPGEILQSPDSESAFGLLESYVVLYEISGNNKWLTFAEETAHQCSSWCVSYDYNYEKHTQFGLYDIKTTGAVFANVQNKHAAPGICTLSGSTLLRLYRATGQIEYLNLLKGIAHNMTQFISTSDRPLYSSYVWTNKINPKNAQLRKRRYVQFLRKCYNNKFTKSLIRPLYDSIVNAHGRINERVNLSDWEGFNNVGELPKGSCWCEVSMLLTFLEVPGVYIDKSRKFVYAFDHVIADTVESMGNKDFSIKLTNPTKFPTEYRIYIDFDIKKRISDCCLESFVTVKLDPNESKIINI